MLFGLEEHVYNSSGSNVSNTSYYSLGGRLIGKFDGANTQYYLTDAQGSVQTTFSNAATTTSVSGYQAYGPYGNKLASSGSMSTAKGFTGQYQDPTGLDYYNARYYDPVIGCFTSADTVQGNAQGMDPYSYVNGNPETLTDPTGQTVSHCHEPGDCGPDSYTTNVSGGTSSDPGSVTQSGGGGCDASCQGPQKIRPVPILLGPSYKPQPIAVKCSDEPQCVANFNASHAQADQQRQNQINLIHVEMLASFALHVIGDDPGTTGMDENEYYNQLQELNVEQQNEALTLAETFVDVCSFTPQTEVTTADGKQEIGTLQKGEKVLAYNPKTHKMELQPILHVWVNKDNDLVDLTITSTASAQHGTPAKHTDEVIHTNQKHPFLTTEQGFVPVAQLHVGMHVLKADGSVGVIAAWQVVSGVQVMYNLEVAQDHTFTVGNSQWIVHNDCGDTWVFNPHILDNHVNLSIKDAARLAGPTGQGVWNSQAAGQTYVNEVIARTPDNAWKKQSDGSYRIDVKDANVPGYIVSSTGYKSSAGGVRIVVVDLGTANQRLVSTFPQYSGFFPSSG